VTTIQSTKPKRNTKNTLSKMRIIKNFNSFVHLNEDASKVFAGTPKIGSWVSELEDSPRWPILSGMGFSEGMGSSYTKKDTHIVVAPDGKKFHLTKAGYVRTPTSGRSAHFGQEDLDTMLFYLIERYYGRWKRKIGRNPSPEDAKLDLEIQKIRDAEDSILFPTPDANLNTQQLKFLNSVCRDQSGSPSMWTFNVVTREIDVDGTVTLGSKIDHPSYKGMVSIPAKIGLKFGHIKGNIDATQMNLTTMEGKGFPHTVDGSFWCSHNKLVDLMGAPSKVGRDFHCEDNPLQTLVGAPFMIDGDFLCDNFMTTNKGTWEWMRRTKPGNWFDCNWDFEGWLKVLQGGDPDAQRLMATLPYLSPDWFNEELKMDPGKTVHMLAPIWKLLDPKVRAGIKIPPGYEDEFDLFSGLDELGLF
jgi:hypothetical protein